MFFDLGILCGMIDHFTRFLFWVDDDLVRFYLGNQGELGSGVFFLGFLAVYRRISMRSSKKIAYCDGRDAYWLKAT
jgi:hypothetical protein